MSDLLMRQWWLLVLRGVIAILFGAACFALPGVTLATLVLLFGAYALVDGVFLTIGSIRGWSEREDHWMLLLLGLLGIGVGVLTFRAPGVTAVSLLLYISAWSLAGGVMSMIAAIRLRREIKGEIWLALSGLASIVFAAIILWNPIAGALSLLWVIGAYAVVIGALMVALGIEAHGMAHRPMREARAS